MNIFSYEWIAPGWLIALREVGGLDARFITASRADLASYVAELQKAVKDWHSDARYSSILLSTNDYPVVSEFMPEISKKPPAQLHQLQEVPDDAGRESIGLEGVLWLVQGWSLALRAGGGYHLAHITAQTGESDEYLQSLLSGIRTLASREDTSKIFLSVCDFELAAENLTRAD